MVPSEESPPSDMAAVIERDLEYDRHRYEETQNPMWAWSAIRTTLEFEVPTPLWLHNYLFQSAMNLIGTAGDDRATASERALAALGFRSRRGHHDLREYHQEMLTIKRGGQMWGRVELKGESAKRASNDLSVELGMLGDRVDDSTLRRAFRKVKKRFSKA